MLKEGGVCHNQVNMLNSVRYDDTCVLPQSKESCLREIRGEGCGPIKQGIPDPNCICQNS